MRLSSQNHGWSLLPKLKAGPKPRGLGKHWAEQGTRTVSARSKDGTSQASQVGGKTARPTSPARSSACSGEVRSPGAGVENLTTAYILFIVG